MKSRLLVIALLTLLWAGLYLPALGDTELKGEEPRRIMPGLHMIQSGDWLHTYIGATPYVRKPPLVNWAIAASVVATGSYSEFAYRLPSVLAVLLLVVGTAVFTWRWLGIGGAFLAGVFILTNISMLEKGRLAEIEAIYIACSGLAIAWWLPRFARGESAWSQWAVPGIFLGLGMLAKGPAHILYFYAVVIGACWTTKNWRTLLTPAHGLALLLTAAIFAAWAIPYAHSGASPSADPETAAATAKVSAAWLGQLTSRLGFDDFKFADWALNIPRGILNLLPWALFFPLLWNRRWLAALSDDRERALIRGARNGVVTAFVAVSLMPGALERYTLPLMTAILLLLARVVIARSRVVLLAPDRKTAPDWDPMESTLCRAWKVSNLVVVLFGWFMFFGAMIITLAVPPDGSWLLAGIVFFTIGGIITLACQPYTGMRVAPAPTAMLALGSGLIITGIMCYFAAAAPIMERDDNLRPLRARTVGQLPPGTTLWVQDSGWRPFWVYLMPEAHFYTRFKEAPFGPEPLALLVKQDSAERVLTDSRFNTRPGMVLATLQDKEGNKLALLHFPSEPRN